MEYFNYYIMGLIIVLSTPESDSITNQGLNIFKVIPQSSIPKDFKRHIGLAPDTNWEPGLREAAHQTLLKERVTLSHLRERILKAPMSGQAAKVSPFGDVAILARGQLFATPTGFRFVQDPHPNDCIDCHELRQCFGKECEIYLHNGLGERLIALWTVKRLRHRNPEVRYELEYSISPIRKHVWVTKNGGYDYSIPGHVFVVKVMNHLQPYGNLPHYPHPAIPPKVHSNKHPYIPKKPNTGEWVHTKPTYGDKPLVAPPYGPPIKVPSKIPNQLPNYYLPQKRPEDQKTSTTIREPQPTLDYAEIEAYKNLLQVLHQKTSTTKAKPTSKVPITKIPTRVTGIVTSAGTLPTRPPLSHTTWFIPTAINSQQTSEPATSSFESTTWFIPTLPAAGKTTEVSSTVTLSAKPSPSTAEVTKATTTKATSQMSEVPRTTKTVGTKSEVTSAVQTTYPVTQGTKSTPTRPQTIYQHLGGFDSSTSQSRPTSQAMTTYITTIGKLPVTLPPKTVDYPTETTVPMRTPPTQQGLTRPSSFTFIETVKPEEAKTPISSSRRPRPTQPMSVLEYKPTRPMTGATKQRTQSSQSSRPMSQSFQTTYKPSESFLPTRPISEVTSFTRPDTTLSSQTTRPISIPSSQQTRPTVSQTTQQFIPSKSTTTDLRPRPTDGQTTSTFLFSTKVTPPFNLPSRGTKPGYTTQVGTTFQTTQSIFPTNGRPTGGRPESTFPGTTYNPSTFKTDTTLPFQGTQETVRGTDQTTIPFRGTQENIRGTDQTRPTQSPSLGIVTDHGSTFTGTFSTTTKYQTTHFNPSTGTTYSKRPTSHQTTFGTTFGNTFFPGTTTTQYFPETTKPTGLLETTRVTYPQTITTDYQRPIPTFFIDPTHPGYPKTTPTTPFTDGENFKPSQPDPFFHPEGIPSLTRPSTLYTPPTQKPTKTTSFTDFVNTDTNGNSITESGTTLLIPASTNRYSPPATAHTITLSTKLPKPSTPFFKPPIDDYDTELFPVDPNEVHSTTTTRKPEVTPTGDFILPEEDYKPHQIIPDLNQNDPTVFNKLPPTTTMELTTPTINSKEIQEVFDSETPKPKPLTKVEDFNEFFRQPTELPTVPTTESALAKVIYSDFFEASTLLPTRVRQQDLTTPLTSTSQSYSTSVSVQLGKNPKVKVKKLKFHKATVKELPSKGSYKVYEAEQPDEVQPAQELVDVQVIQTLATPSPIVPSPQTPKYGPNGRKYRKSHKFRPSSTPASTKAFDDLALQLVNHARTIDYLSNKPTQETSSNQEVSIAKVSRSSSSSNGSNTRNKYRRKSYGRVRKVKKRPENKGVITRTNREAIKHQTESQNGEKNDQEILKTIE